MKKRSRNVESESYSSAYLTQEEGLENGIFPLTIKRHVIIQSLLLTKFITEVRLNDIPIDGSLSDGNTLRV